jgi:hypothetical protein
MQSYDLAGLRFPRTRTLILSCIVWAMTGSIANSESSPHPPTPHRGPSLPGTHVPPKPIVPVDNPGTNKPKQ